jgi:hypothetical protein
MAKQNLSDQELVKYISLLFDIINPNDSKKLIIDLFGAFVCLVADDYPKQTKQYLDALKKISVKHHSYLRLVK